MWGKIWALSRPPSPPPSPLLETPWREITWGNNRDSLQYLKNFQPQNKDATIRVLLHGPVGAGKSSFINSVNNVLQGRMTTEALASATTSDQSFTLKYQTYKIKKEGRGNFYPFVFNDIMGLEERDGNGVRTKDIILALKGHVKDGHKFNPASSLSDGDSHYNSSPSISDRVHVLVCIHDANAPQIKYSVLEKMREIREAASELGIPQLAILTHIDSVCGETEKTLRNVYKSKHLKKKMRDFSSSLGIPMNCILPVKNYSDETQMNSDVDTLILNALRLMIDFGDDYADKLMLQKDSTSFSSTDGRTTSNTISTVKTSSKSSNVSTATSYRTGSHKMGNILFRPSEEEPLESKMERLKVDKITTGKTFGADQVLCEQLMMKLKDKRMKEKKHFIVFCPIMCCVGSDVKAAMETVERRINNDQQSDTTQDDQGIILVLMHHTRDPDYSTAGINYCETISDVDLNVHVLFHETMQGLLKCSQNEKAVSEIVDFLRQESPKKTKTLQKVQQAEV